MDLKFEKINHHGSILHTYQDKRLSFGFSEKNAHLKDIQSYFKGYAIKELKQVHSDTIFFSDQILPGTEGDGIILNQAKTIAIIKTADCVPLFFWDQSYSIGGILHVGWQGLCKGIEIGLIEILKQYAMPINTLYFYLGPAIEQKCYEVDKLRFNEFKKKAYAKKIFQSSGKEKYLMDIPAGIFLSLTHRGIPKKNIFFSRLCTFCESTFPSYRREGQTNQRIYNFICFFI